jgi:hypothetical protein
MPAARTTPHGCSASCKCATLPPRCWVSARNAAVRPPNGHARTTDGLGRAGFRNHSDYMVQDRMATSYEAAKGFLHELVQHLRGKVSGK